VVFYRTYNNSLVPISSTDILGFSEKNPYYIPKNYLSNQTFVILRTCFGLGDWGIISAFPRKLKEKYPNCKVYIPSHIMLNKMFGNLKNNWDSWDNPFNVVYHVFNNNPYIDGFIDQYNGEIYNDHYRIYNKKNEKVPLLQQILKFWRFDNFTDIEPEIYWTNEEKKYGNEIIKSYGYDQFGTILISNRYSGEGYQKIQNKINEYNLPMFYWISSKTKRWNFLFKKISNLNDLDIRTQMYIKSISTYNIGNQVGVHDTISKYAPTITVPRDNLKSNYIKSQIYI